MRLACGRRLPRRSTFLERCARDHDQAVWKLDEGEAQLIVCERLHALVEPSESLEAGLKEVLKKLVHNPRPAFDRKLLL
jgi:hypothetical protein